MGDRKLTWLMLIVTLFFNLSACSSTPARALFDHSLSEACRQQCWNGKAQAATVTECLKKCEPPR
jgi:hypothetical protein